MMHGHSKDRSKYACEISDKFNCFVDLVFELMLRISEIWCENFAFCEKNLIIFSIVRHLNMWLVILNNVIGILRKSVRCNALSQLDWN